MFPCGGCIQKFVKYNGVENNRHHLWERSLEYLTSKFTRQFRKARSGAGWFACCA